MDVLERLTNKGVLEARVSATQKGVFLDPIDLGTRLKRKIIGQDFACDETAKVICRRMALETRTKPVATVLFVGPPGTGKTYLAKNLAKELERNLIFVDMTQFGQEHAVSQLFGSPPGFCGGDKPPILAAGLQTNPQSIVLLDEVEKAHPAIQTRFLVALNDGHLVHATTNAKVNCTKSIWCLTTNAAQDQMVEIARQYKDDPEGMLSAAKAALVHAKFNDAVLSRIDRIIIFQQMQGLDIARVAALEIEAMVEAYGVKLAPNGIDVDMLFSVLERQNKLGASATTRDIARSAEDQISDSIIDCKQQGATHVRIVQVDGKFRAVPGNPPQEPSASVAVSSAPAAPVAPAEPAPPIIHDDVTDRKVVASELSRLIINGHNPDVAIAAIRDGSGLASLEAHQASVRIAERAAQPVYDIDTDRKLVGAELGRLISEGHGPEESMAAIRAGAEHVAPEAHAAAIRINQIRGA